MEKKTIKIGTWEIVFEPIKSWYMGQLELTSLSNRFANLLENRTKELFVDCNAVFIRMTANGKTILVVIDVLTENL